MGARRVKLPNDGLLETLITGVFRMDDKFAIAASFSGGDRSVRFCLHFVGQIVLIGFVRYLGLRLMQFVDMARDCESKVLMSVVCPFFNRPLDSSESNLFFLH